MRIWKKTFRIVTTNTSAEMVRCSFCGSERLDEIGDVLQCIDCKAVKALS